MRPMETETTSSAPLRTSLSSARSASLTTVGTSFSVARAFLSPGERRLLAELEEHELPAELKAEDYTNEADVVRSFMDAFDARLEAGLEPSRTAQEDESEQLALLQPPKRRGGEVS